MVTFAGHKSGTWKTMQYALGMQPKAALFVAALSFLLAAQPCAEAEVQPGGSLQQFLRGNDRFGLKLLAEIHAEAQERNAVVAPISLTILLSALEANSWRGETQEQLQHLFGWERGVRPGIPSNIQTTLPKQFRHTDHHRSLSCLRLRRGRGPA